MGAELFYVEVTEQIDSVVITEEIVYVEERNLPASELYTDSKATSLSVVASSNLATNNSKATSLSVVASSNLASDISRATSLSVVASSNKAAHESAASSLSRRDWVGWVLS